MHKLLKIMMLISLVAGLALTTASVTRAGGINGAYAGPKTWLPGWDAASSYDGGAPWYQTSYMAQKSCSCWARVAFITTSGSWTYSYTDTFGMTLVEIPSGSVRYTKKPYCKNNSSSTYTAHCGAFTLW